MTVPSDLTPQRWERLPFNFPPGIWKKQLAERYRDIAARGDMAGLRDLLAEHPEFLNKRGSHNRTLLWEAVSHGKFAAVKWLVEQGADVNITACHNGGCYVQLTPYCAALYFRRTEIADYLHPLTAPPDIFRTAFLGDAAIVARELDAHPELLHSDDPQEVLYYVPLLAFPIVGGYTEVLELLLKRGAVVAPYSAQLIYLAARDARMDMVKLLAAHGAEIPAVDTGIFVHIDDLAMFDYLLAHGAQVNKHGKNSFPPLVFLSRGDKGEHPEKIELLLKYGAKVDEHGPKRRTALHYAAVAGFTRVMDLLLMHGATVNLRDEAGETALDKARRTGKQAAIDLLKQHGAR